MMEEDLPLLRSHPGTSRREKVMKLRIVAIVAFAVALSQCVSANAALTIVSAVGGQPSTAPGVKYVNFDFLSGDLAYDTTNADYITVGLKPDAAVVSGSASGLYAAPYLSSSNGVLFGDNTVSGVDKTPYLTSGKEGGSYPDAAVTLTFTAYQKYLGLLWGSVDSYNTLEFFSGSTLVGSITGAQVLANPNGDQGLYGTVYVNIDSTVPFNKVVASSSEYAFEFDNVAYNSANYDGTGAVPEPATLAIWSIFGAGAAGVAAARRRRRGRWSDADRQAIYHVIDR